MEKKFNQPKFELPNELASSEKIKDWAKRYNEDPENKKDVEIGDELVKDGRDAKKAGHLNKEQLKDIVKWKTNGRQVHNAEKNDDDWVKEVSQNSFASTNSDKRIEYLARGQLKGVGDAVASAILHFVFLEQNEYPIIDVRALRTVTGNEYKPYQYWKLWTGYCKFCREMAGRYNVDMRTLDKALWQFDKVKYG